MNPVDILKQYWGYSEFRPLQEEIIQEVLLGKDTFAILPTGGGKSMCFQVPALIRDGICLVITPLIALMKDQVENLKQKGITAAAIYSGMNSREIDIILDNCIYGKVKFLYFSPERIQSHIFQERVKRMNVNLIAVDEAHCISQWGHDFRPAYFEVAKLKEFAPNRNLIALTATATEKVRNEIVDRLELQIERIFTGTFARKNLSYSVRKVEDKEKKILEILSQTSGSAIIYSKTRKETKEVSQWLNQMNVSSAYYHAGLANDTRTAIQEKWKSGIIRVVVATNAFGMGIDKPDVRAVIHMGINSNMESYYQEAGRAGRDSEKAYAVILYQETDVEDSLSIFHRSYPDLAFVQHIYQCLANYYKLAVGSEHHSGFDFNLYKFSDQYNLEHLEVFYALKKLEEYNLVQFSEVIYGTSALMILMEHKRLYEFQVGNSHLDKLIKVLLRTHGGELFTGFCQISEYKLSKALHYSVDQVKKELSRLHKRGVISYSQKKDYPQLVFLTPRLDAANLPIHRKTYDNRRDVELDKMKFMIGFVSNNRGCRTNAIQEYFGEVSKEECGVCDNCIDKKKSSVQTNHVEDYLLQLVNQGEFTSHELVDKLADFSAEEVLSTIRQLLDAGMISEEDGKLVK